MQTPSSSNWRRQWIATVATANMLLRGREQLIKRTQTRNSSLFNVLYDSEETPALQALLFEREAVGWVDLHVNLIQEGVARQSCGAPIDDTAASVERAMIQAQDKLLRRLLNISCTTEATAGLLSNYHALLSRLISGAVRDQVDYEDLLSAQARHRAIYRRARDSAERVRKH